eukprot:262847_1
MSRYLLICIICVVHTNAFPYTLLVGELLYFSLAIIDLLSDANLLISMQDAQLNYLSNQEKLKTSMTSDEYIFEECLPTQLTSKWKTKMNTYCQCNPFTVSCEHNSDGLFVHENTLMDNTSFIEIAETYISCKPHLWALESKFQTTFAFTNWTCNQCECIGNEYDKTNSIPLLKSVYEYESLNSQKIQYCNPNKLLTDEYNDKLNKILIACWTFLFTGSLAQCIAICCRWFALQIILTESNHDDDEDVIHVKLKDSVEYSFLWDAAKFVVGFMVSLLEDVPQTIVAMYYLEFLYADNGYYCHESFVESPALQRMSLNPQNSITVILVENINIAFAVATSVIMIVFTGIRNGFNLQDSMRKKYYIGNDKVLISIGVIIILCGSIIYVLSLLMPIAAVAFFSIAPSFHKEWIPAFVVFVCGCVSWGIIFWSCCVLFVVTSHDVL